MALPQRAPDGQVELVEVATGRLRSFWVVDAKAHLASGACRLPDDAPAPTPVPEPVPADLVPGLRQMEEHPLGMPANASTAAELPPAELMGEPVRRSNKKAE